MRSIPRSPSPKRSAPVSAAADSSNAPIQAASSKGGTSRFDSPWPTRAVGKLPGEGRVRTGLPNIDPPHDPRRELAERSFGPLRGLPKQLVQQLLTLATGSSEIAGRAREALQSAAARPGFSTLPAGKRAAKLRAAFNGSVLEVVSGDALKLIKGRRSQPGSIGPAAIVSGFDFDIQGYTHKTVAERIELTVNGRIIPVYRPPGDSYATRSGKARVNHSLEDVARALSLLPLADLLRVKDVRLSPVPNPEDALWAKRYGEPGFSSYMNAGADGTVIIFPWDPEHSRPPRELAVYMMHEIAHVSSNHRWGPGRGHGMSEDWKRWRDAMKADGLFVSVYAKASIEEDFAETDSLRRLLRKNPEHTAELRELFPNRVRLLDAQFPLA